MTDEPEGVSSRQLLAAFFAVVLLCAVFFSLGFFLGHKERSPESSLVVDQVPSSSSGAQSAVNPPEQQVPSDASPGSAAGGSSDQGTAAGGPSSAPSPQSNTAETPAPAAAPREEPVNGQAAQPTAAQPVALQTPAASPPGRAPPGSLIQVAALTNQQDANELVGVLQSRGYPALILTPQQAHANDSLFRVVAGPYKTRAEAEKARDRLAAAGFKPFIRR